MRQKLQVSVGAVAVVGLAFVLAGVSGCEQRGTPGGDGLSGEVVIDGSSTVYPIMQATAEKFEAAKPGVRVPVGRAGSGAGFKKFLAEQPELRTDLSNASRTIKPTEVAKAAELGIEFVELPVAYDGIAVVVHPENDFVDHLTIAELERIWKPNSPINNWSQVRDGFPDLELRLYGPTGDSGTFEYFTETVVGEARSCRTDYAPSATVQVVQGVSGDPRALGYFGYAYYNANQDKLKLLKIDNGEDGPIAPTPETINSLKYRPLSRPLFSYVNVSSAERPEVDAFVKYFFDHAKEIVEHERVGYVALSDKLYETIRQRYNDRVTGTMFPDVASHHKSLYDLYGVERQ